MVQFNDLINSSISIENYLNKVIHFKKLDSFQITVLYGYNYLIFPYQWNVNSTTKLCFQTNDTFIAFSLSSFEKEFMIIQSNNSIKSLLINNSGIKYFVSVIYNKTIFDRNCTIKAYAKMEMTMNPTANDASESQIEYFMYKKQAQTNISLIRGIRYRDSWRLIAFIQFLKV